MICTVGWSLAWSARMVGSRMVDIPPVPLNWSLDHPVGGGGLQRADQMETLTLPHHLQKECLGRGGWNSTARSHRRRMSELMVAVADMALDSSMVVLDEKRTRYAISATALPSASILNNVPPPNRAGRREPFSTLSTGADLEVNVLSGGGRPFSISRRGHRRGGVWRKRLGVRKLIQHQLFKPKTRHQ
jgi:hypothetical protein